jgi:hypothetical protein
MKKIILVLASIFLFSQTAHAQIVDPSTGKSIKGSDLFYNLAKLQEFKIMEKGKEQSLTGEQLSSDSNVTPAYKDALKKYLVLRTEVTRMVKEMESSKTEFKTDSEAYKNMEALVTKIGKLHTMLESANPKTATVQGSLTPFNHQYQSAVEQKNTVGTNIADEHSFELLRQAAGLDVDDDDDGHHPHRTESGTVTFKPGADNPFEQDPSNEHPDSGTEGSHHGSFSGQRGVAPPTSHEGPIEESRI